VLGPELVKAQVMPVSDVFNSYRILRKLEIQNMLDFIRIKVSICQWYTYSRENHVCMSNSIFNWYNNLILLKIIFMFFFPEDYVYLIN